MQIDNLEKRYEKIDQELQNLEDVRYALGVIIWVLKEANKERSRISGELYRINNLRADMDYSRKKGDRREFRFPPDLCGQESRLLKMQAAPEEVIYYEEIVKISWYEGCEFSFMTNSYDFETGVKKENSNWEEDTKTFDRRIEIIKQMCKNLGIAFSFRKEEKYYPDLESREIKFNLRFAVPVPMIEIQEEVDIKKLMYGLKNEEA